MKTFLQAILGCSICLIASIRQSAFTQTIEYKTFIYTDQKLPKEIQQLNLDNTNRGFGSDILNATLNATKGIASGWVTSLVDMGITAIASLATINSRHKAEWEEIVQKENIFETKLATLSEINDFYNSISTSGPMDPKGMIFNGIGCLKTENGDTTFYISCHIDRKKLDRIAKHSKFELVLDTLIISPLYSNLPNTNLDIPFSFDERKDYNFNMTIRVTSSWITSGALLQKDQLLGEFSINLPIDQTDLDSDGFLRYIRPAQEESKYPIVGECFIIPRSYMGYRDMHDIYHDQWGTGEYKISLSLKETCNTTESYQKNWKVDYKKRKKMKESNNFIKKSWKIIQNQQWDEMAQSWIITTLKAPAGIAKQTLNKAMGYEQQIPPSNSTKRQ